MKIALAVGGLGLALGPLALTSYQLGLLTKMLILAIFAMSLNVLLGYTGLPSLGHAAYFGAAAYTVALLARRGLDNFWLDFGAGVVVATLTALLFGLLALRTRGAYLLMITLALAQVLWGIAFGWRSFTGGDDGLRGIPLHPLTLPGISIRLDASLPFYYFTLVLVGLAFAGLKRILDSPFGAVLQAIRENPARATACGYDINRAKWLSFVFSATFCGLAGGLDALRLSVVPIESLFWTTSGQVVMMTLLGGAGTFFGPFVGAATFLVLEARLAVFTESWPLVIGSIFVLFVLFLPRGIWGTLTGGLHGR